MAKRTVPPNLFYHLVAQLKFLRPISLHNSNGVTLSRDHQVQVGYENLEIFDQYVAVGLGNNTRQG